MKAFLSQDALVAAFILLFAISSLAILFPRPHAPMHTYACAFIWRNITENGTLTIEPSGYSGPACLNLTRGSTRILSGACPGPSSSPPRLCEFRSPVIYNGMLHNLSIAIYGSS